MIPNRSVATREINIPAGINLLLGIWLFVSPWVYGAYTHASSWNSWIVGALIAILAAIRLKSHVTGVSWFNTVLGVWVFFSPWIYGYTYNTDRFVNSLCLGVLVFLLSLSAASRTRTHTTTVAHS